MKVPGVTPARLEVYMRRVATLQYDSVKVPPFLLFFHPHDPLVHFNYARPLEPVGGDLRDPLTALRAVFMNRGRVPRFEFVEEFAPDLAPALREAGFVEEDRLHLMVCTPESLCSPPEVPGLEIALLGPDSPRSELRLFCTVQRQGFEGQGTASEAEGEALRRTLARGARAFLARLDGRPAAAGIRMSALDGLAEIAGVATLEAFRRRGIATSLVGIAARTAFEEGVEACFLIAADERAGRVYERVGFGPFATVLIYHDRVTAESGDKGERR